MLADKIEKYFEDKILKPPIRLRPEIRIINVDTFLDYSIMAIRQRWTNWHLQYELLIQLKNKIENGEVKYTRSNRPTAGTY